MSELLEWVKDNPVTVIAIIVYVVANFAPRPHPEDQKGWVKALWQIIDRLCLLTTRVAPRVKLPLLDSPSHEAKNGNDKGSKTT